MRGRDVAMISGEHILEEETVQRHLEEAREIIEQRLITSHFQPIVDLQRGAVIGWEVLARGPAALSSPAEMFAAAAKLGLTARLELACRFTALRSIAGLPSAARSRLFFLNVLNVGASLAGAPMSCDGRAGRELAGFGIDRRNLVIEITERQSTTDYQAFERHIRHCVDQGFRVALDDVGAGHSGLVTLVTCSPHFMKLDISLARDIQHHAHRQQLVKRLVAFAASVDALPIAEGVETWDELDTLARLGVRYAQGFLFARPSQAPRDISEEDRLRIRRVMRRFNYRESDLSEAVGPLVMRCASIGEGEKRGEDVDRMLRSDALLDHLVVVRGNRPIGLITRQSYYTNTGGPVGYPLFQWKPAEQLARSAPLIVEDSISVTALARLAMDRPSDEIYDPVVVVDGDGRLLGTVTIRQLLRRSSVLEVQSAQGASPLTGLPGNRSIERWLLDAWQRPDACVLYADLDRFKEFNDRYGFVQGDEMIRCLAEVLSGALPALAPEARLGHIGGDDFVVVAFSAVAPGDVEAFCRRFDEAKLALFDPDDIQRGWFRTTDRRGADVTVPLVTLSVAVVPVDAMRADDHLAALAQRAASLKHKVKEMTAASGQSAYLFERRRCGPENRT